MKQYKSRIKEDLLAHFLMFFGLTRLVVIREKRAYKKTDIGWKKYYNLLIEEAVNSYSKRKKTYEQDKELKEKIHEVFLLRVFPKKKDDLLESIKSFLDKKHFYFDKELICGPDNKEGVEEHHISMLINHSIKEVKIKEGIPFLPSFFIAFIITWWLGNWIVFVL